MTDVDSVQESSTLSETKTDDNSIQQENTPNELDEKQEIKEDLVLFLFIMNVFVVFY